MKYIILKTNAKGNERRFVAESGSKNSYTASKARAKTFDSYESAKADCCGNEMPIEK